MNIFVFMIFVDVGEKMGFFVIIFLIFVVFLIIVSGEFLKILDFIFILSIYLIIELGISIFFIMVFVF